MFSQGQIIFAAIFLVVFIVAMIAMYRKDAVLHQRYYKGSIWVLVAFLLFIGVLFMLKSVLKN
ncbi:MAG TPA: hypothetical protein VKY33_08635 [Flavobacterium sp.]|nr:hypothetical protein [Flavobacterium sp.]